MTAVARRPGRLAAMRPRRSSARLVRQAYLRRARRPFARLVRQAYLRRARRPFARLVRPTHALGALAVGLTVAVVALEYAHIWRRGRAPLPAETADVFEAGREAALETVEVAVAGYRAGTPRENALLNLLLSYAVTFGLVRLSTHTIRAHGRWGPVRNVLVRERHIHHFIPGIAIAFLAGGISIVSRNEDIDRWLAVPFGIGTALTLDEAALLIEFEDVYWTEEGILSIQVTLAAMALLGAAGVGLRLLRRGEAQVFDLDPASGNGRVAPQ